MKDIPGYENRYAVTKDGRVWSYYGKKFMAPSISRFGYCKINLYTKEKRKTFLVHRLVLLTYVGKSDFDCNHKNGIKADNRLNNLEYCTKSENILHAFKTGLRVAPRTKGEAHGNSKLKEHEVYEIKFKEKGSARVVGDKYGVSRTSIFNIRNGLRWAHINE